MFVEITVWVEIPVVEETPIDIVVEPLAPLDAPDIMREDPPPPVAEQRPGEPASTPIARRPGAPIEGAAGAKRPSPATEAAIM